MFIYSQTRKKLSAAEIALPMVMAELPVFETLADMERKLNAKQRSAQDYALETLRAASVTVTVVSGLEAYNAGRRRA